MQDEQQKNIAVKPNGLEIGGRLHPLYSGSVHYWRLGVDVWEKTLDRVLEMGFRFVCTYIPWSAHETARGEYDFGGKRPENDIDRFLALCGEKGLFVLVRPGPHINSEITYFGYPKRLFADGELLSRNPDGAPVIVPAPPRMFPAPGYACEKFWGEVALYFDALCPILKRHLYPAGPIVGTQADNEMSLFFRTQPYDHDYSRPSIALYHKFLGYKYGSVDEINKVYTRTHSAFEQIMPPREFAPSTARDLPYYLDWMEYKEYYLLNGINRAAQMLRDRGLTDIFYFHNYPADYPATPYNVPMTEKAVDVQGVDMYHARQDYRLLKRGASFLSATSRMPFIPEFGSGVWLWWKPLLLDDQKFTTPAVFMHGLKAINFYMLVERERWYGSPVTRHGEIRENYFNYYKKFIGFLHDARFHEYKMRAEALLLSVQEYERLQLAASLASPVPDLAFGMPPDWLADPRPVRGLRDCVQSVYQRQRRAYELGFARAGIPLDSADSGVESSRIEAFKLVICPSFDFMSMSLQRKLLVYVLRGGTLVLGPRAPRMDGLMREDSKMESHLLRAKSTAPTANYQGMLLEQADIFETEPFLNTPEGAVAYVRPLEKGRIIHLGFLFPEYEKVEQSPVLTAIMSKIATLAGVARPYPPDDPLVETRLHTRGNEKILFVANPTGEARAPRVAALPGDAFTDLLESETFTGEGGVTVPLAPYTIRILRVEKKKL